MLAKIAAWPLRVLVAVYRYGISPLTPGHCRYLPTCSQYAEEALHVHGPLRGSFFALNRICRCHPWGGSGYDPVPSNPASVNSPEGKPERS